MSDVTQTIDAIREAVSEMGLPAFSRFAGVPYTTLLHWEKSGFRPKVISTFEKLADAARRHDVTRLTAPPPKSKEAA